MILKKLEFSFIRHSRENGNPIWLTVVKRKRFFLSLSIGLACQFNPGHAETGPI